MGFNAAMQLGARRLIAKPQMLFLVAAFAIRLQADAAEADRDDFNRYLQGRYVFKSQCAPCHGETGRGNGPWAAEMSVKPRNFRMGIFKYRSTPMGHQPTDDDLRRTIKRGVSGTAMPTFAKTLSNRDLDAILVYLKNLSRRWQEDSRISPATELPDPPKWFSQTNERRERAQAGRRLFAQTCVSCHGDTGAGDGLASKGLTNVSGQVAVPADLRVEHHRSGPGRSDLFRTISLGLDGTPMVGFRGALKDQQIWELVAAIEQLPLQEKEASTEVEASGQRANNDGKKIRPSSPRRPTP